MVITNAATGNPNVKALVYMDAFIPARGETAFGLTGAKPGSCLRSANAVTAVPYPGAPAGDFDAYLKAGPDAPYPGLAQCFADGLPASQAAVLAATQRLIALSAGSAPSGVPAWKTIPSWSLIGTADHVIPRPSCCSCPGAPTPHHRDQRRAPIPDLPPGRGDPRYHRRGPGRQPIAEQLAGAAAGLPRSPHLPVVTSMNRTMSWPPGPGGQECTVCRARPSR